ncbi:hypothetical protein H9L39_17577 [Fusarium oxysporum f. sp. albedinis]|nr:hypothetical protein H9L39_17577 [Fusarium oxysporum f. sp. albedinis]
MGDTVSRTVSMNRSTTERTNGVLDSMASQFRLRLRIVSHLQAAEKRVLELTWLKAAVCGGLGTIRS